MTIFERPIWNPAQFVVTEFYSNQLMQAIEGPLSDLGDLIVIYL